MAYHLWTAPEDEILAKWYNHITVTRVQEKLLENGYHRSLSSIMSRAQKTGVMQNTPAELKKIIYKQVKAGFLKPDALEGK